MPTALIVEDEPTIRALAEALVGSLGYDTLTAGSGAEALALLEGSAPVDLLFTDIALGPGPDGLAVAQTAKQRRPGVKVLYTSGQTLTDGLQALMVDGGAFLPKPYTPEEIAASIESVRPPEE